MRTSLNSSAIESVDYDPDTGHLEIWFTHSGGPYSFYRVPYERYYGLITSSSPGAYYNRYIRGRYR
jgi:hypothetical protein